MNPLGTLWHKERIEDSFTSTEEKAGADYLEAGPTRCTIGIDLGERRGTYTLIQVLT
ncbi:MAG: hypothetical protein ABIH23_31705 [bacterium]